MIYDVKIYNNWAYLSEYLKHYYDLGLPDPNNISRVLYNQVNFADSCNFNNVYIFAVPKAITNATTVEYLSPANKQLIISTMDSIKTMTSEIILLDPIYISYAVCAPQTSPTLESANESYINIVKDPASKRDDQSLKRDLISVFEDYFRRENLKLGQTIDLTQMMSDILSIPGIKKIYTVSESTGNVFEGISLLQWDAIYPEASLEVIYNNKTLNNFMFPVFDDAKLLNGEKIRVSSSNRDYQTIEY